MIEAEFRSRISAVSFYLRSLRELEARHKTPGSGFYRAAATLSASRAASFIMIYNCVEFATRETIAGVRKYIQTDTAAFHEITEFWQEDIIRMHFKKKLEDGINHTTLLKEFRSFVPGKVDWLQRENSMPFPGNIDHERLIKFAKDIGVRKWRPPARTLGGSDLLTVRTTRNELAHGEETFESVGGNYSVTDIVDKLDRIRSFMCSYIRMMDRYQIRKSYKII